jgi:ketosteroid isomerase-like protein
MIGALMAKRNARKRFAARAENDVETFLASFAEDAVFKFPGESPVGGTFRGREAIRAQFEQFRDRTKGVQFELVNVFVNRLLAFGATNEVAVQWRMRLGDLSNEGVAIVHIRRGQIVLLHEFLFNPLPAEALRDPTREPTGRPSKSPTV